MPLHLRSLRRAVVTALHTFNHDAAVHQQHEKKARAAAEAAGEGREEAGGGEKENAPSPSGGGNGSGKAVASSGATASVGLDLATALNDLELDLLGAQRARRRQHAEVRGAGKECSFLRAARVRSACA